MNTPRHIAFIGNSSPRRCGIATFTSDLQQAVAASSELPVTAIVAMTDNHQVYAYPNSVTLQIQDGEIAEYISAAEMLNKARYDMVCLQHEFGIFGGESGAYILELLSRLTMPIVTTLHTVLANPSASQRDVLNRIVDVSAMVVVMAEKGRTLLRDVYNVPDSKIEIIAHGIPDFAYVPPDAAKTTLGFAGKQVILTFGLLNPNKGIEVMIEAMPEILRSAPNAVYVVLGATHPHLVRQQGEKYRERLQARAQALGIAHAVVFLDQFVNLDTLVQFISMCDVYATPYLNEAQMTSGTLAYSYGLGKAVVSTPYWHASELLADGKGVLVPFNDAGALSREIGNLLTDDIRRDAMRTQAYADSRTMTWARSAERYLSVFSKAQRAQSRAALLHKSLAMPARSARAVPALQLTHFHDLCDETGLFQHAVHCVPNRWHGFCVDDNARALLLASELNILGEQRFSDALTSRFAAFIQHAWIPESRRFHNFLSYDRRWLDDTGSEDSHGRALWALGHCARFDSNVSRRTWAFDLFGLALPALSKMGSPRAWAFTLLGLEPLLQNGGAAQRQTWRATQRSLADQLMHRLQETETPAWRWFESGLAYDNARLSQALIVTGKQLSNDDMVHAGLRTLRWLMQAQTASVGYFQPVGSDGFADVRMRPRAFDQQPLEATAAIAACMCAAQVDDSQFWNAEAARAFAWFVGSNALATPLVDLETGACHDGLHRDRVNENQGGESAVSYLLALAALRRAARSTEFAEKPRASWTTSQATANAAHVNE